jgi:hypothetical protein
MDGEKPRAGEGKRRLRAENERLHRELDALKRRAEAANFLSTKSQVVGLREAGLGDWRHARERRMSVFWPRADLVMTRAKVRHRWKVKRLKIFVIY